MAKRAQEIVDSQAPDPVAYDANGKSVRGVISPEFLQWVKDNNIPKDEAESEEMGSFAGELSLMASTGDRRGLPILRVGIELGRASRRWRVTSPALSVAGWVHNSTIATFPEAPL